jgi:hypothetical protein
MKLDARAFLTAALCLLAVPLVAARGTGSNVAIYGPAGTFGSLETATSTSSGDSLTHQAVPYGFSRGQSAIFPAVTSDHTVFVPGYSQTGRYLSPAGCTVEIACFNESAAVCRDPDTGLAVNSALLRVPNAIGTEYFPDSACDDFAAGGSVPDLAVMGAGAAEKVVFDADTLDVEAGWPMWGAVRKINGLWQVDETSLRTAFELHDSNPPTSEDVCPIGKNGCCSDSECGGGPGSCVGAACGFFVRGTCEVSCDSDDDCSTLGARYQCRDGSCVLATCNGINELAVLPASGRVVVTHYNGWVSVNDGGGTFLAAYEIPTVANPCGSGNITTSPRAVETDPTGALGDEHFVVSYDTSDVSQAVQEFRYDDSTHTITPLTSPFFATIPWGTTPSCSGVKFGAGGRYDELGNLWVGRAELLPTYTVVYFKDAATGLTSAGARCPGPGSWGTLCPADVGIGYWNGNTMTPFFAHPWTVGSGFDPAQKAFFVSTVTGGLVPILRRIDSGGTPYFVITPPVKLDTSELELAPDQVTGPAPLSYALDPSLGNLWTSTGSGCRDTCGPLAPGPEINTWLYRIRVDPVVAARSTILSVTTTITRPTPTKLRFKLTIKTNSLTQRPSGMMVDRVFLYRDDNPTPIQKDMDRSSNAQGYTYQADNWQFTDSPPSTRLQWYAVLTDVLSTSDPSAPPIVVSGSATPP